MAYKAKVRHGLVPYTRHDPLTDRDYEDRAFRGMTIEIEDRKEYDRLLALGAIVKPDDELAEPGRLTALPDTATDEEILNWALSATASEVKAAARERPLLAQRLEAAGTFARERAAAYNEHLGGIVEAAYEGADEAGEAADRLAAVAPTPGAASLVPQPGAGLTGGQTGAPDGDTNRAPGPPPADSQPRVETVTPPETETPTPADPATAGTAGDGTSTETEDLRFDAVVKGNRDAVIRYISEHPEEASAILDAENRRAATDNDQPRVSVIRAVEAAVTHTG